MFTRKERVISWKPGFHGRVLHELGLHEPGLHGPGPENDHKKVNSSMEKLVESFITELECHRRNISKEIEDVANTRINELNATLKRLEEVCPYKYSL